jgi:hypothetical protein
VQPGDLQPDEHVLVCQAQHERDREPAAAQEPQARRERKEHYRRHHDASGRDPQRRRDRERQALDDERGAPRGAQNRRDDTGVLEPMQPAAGGGRRVLAVRNRAASRQLRNIGRQCLFS